MVEVNRAGSATFGLDFVTRSPRYQHGIRYTGATETCVEGDEWIGTGRDQDAVLLLSGAGDAVDELSALCRDALDALRSMRIHCDLPSATWTDTQLDEHIYVFSGGML